MKLQLKDMNKVIFFPFKLFRVFLNNLLLIFGLLCLQIPLNYTSHNTEKITSMIYKFIELQEN